MRRPTAEVTLHTVEMLMEYEPALDADVKDFDAASGAARDWFLEHPGTCAAGR